MRRIFRSIWFGHWRWGLNMLLLLWLIAIVMICLMSSSSFALFALPTWISSKRLLRTCLLLTYLLEIISFNILREIWLNVLLLLLLISHELICMHHWDKITSCIWCWVMRGVTVKIKSTEFSLYFFAWLFFNIDLRLREFTLNRLKCRWW